MTFSHLTNRNVAITLFSYESIDNQNITNSKLTSTFTLTDFNAGVKATDSEQDFSSNDNIDILGTPSIFVYFDSD